MNNRTFQGRFRPLVNRAWETQAHITGAPVTDKTARDAWYRKTLGSVIHRNTTSAATDQEQTLLLKTFAAIAEAEHEVPVVHGWTEAQNIAFEELVLDAWDKSGGHNDAAFRPWLHRELDQFFRTPWKVYGKLGRTVVFDRIMAHLACIADNDYWLRRTAAQDEVRYRWQIRQKLKDLEKLTGEAHHWDYVRSIWGQSKQLPTDIMDAPAASLHQVLCMLDTHVRRIADRTGEDVETLPSRLANNPDLAIL